MRLLITLTLLITGFSLSAHAAKRVGLVIGNDAYSDVPALRKAVGDAEAMSETLAEQGFEIITVLNAPRREMNRRIAEFTSRLEPGDTALVFFAGHGVEIDGENYLLPTDIAAPGTDGEDFIKFESFALSDLLDRVRSTGARTTLVFLDACRDNPFTSVAGRSIGRSRGLGRITAPEGTFVVFSAGAGQQALDELHQEDDNSNSVFTRLLLPKLRTPDLELRELIADLRVEVRDLAKTQNHQQFPAYYDELLGDFYFASARGLAPVPSVARDAKGVDRIRADFALAREIGSAAALQAFLESYEGKSDDFTVSLARSLLNDTQVASVAQDPAEAPAPKPEQERLEATDRREIVRQSQARLNALGCEAGGADGIAGRRTRAAFADFIDQSDASLDLSDLGSQTALDALNAAQGTICKPKAVAAAPTASTGSSNLGRLAGTWYFRASCPLFIKTTGSVVYTHLGGNRYRAQTRDSLGQTATGEATFDGVKYSGTNTWNNGIKTRFSGTIAPDGRRADFSNSVGCSVVASKG